MKVRNMTSSKGNTIANQFLITGIPAGSFHVGEVRVMSGEMFQSYNSNIAYRDHTGSVYLDETYWDYSVTTGRYRNQFLDEGIADTRKKIESGEYVLTNLN